jgi:hypothetical protein
VHNRITQKHAALHQESRKTFKTWVCDWSLKSSSTIFRWKLSQGSRSTNWPSSTLHCSGHDLKLSRFENHPIYHIAVDNRVYALNYPRGCIISSAHVHLIRSTMMDKGLLRRNDDPPFPNNPRHRLEAGISSTLFITHRSNPVSLSPLLSSSQRDCGWSCQVSVPDVKGACLRAGL